MTYQAFSPCPDKPNCVSSLQPNSRHYVEPLRFDGDMKDAKAKLIRIVEELPRAEVVDETDTYIRTTFTSFLFRFTDDVEFRIDDVNKVIHMKSASRLGYSDLGINRRRCEKIRELFDRR